MTSLRSEKLRTLPKATIKERLNSAMGELYASGVVLKYQDYLRTEDNGAKKANNVATFLEEAKESILGVLGKTGNDKEIRYVEELEGVCQWVRSVTRDLCSRLTGLSGVVTAEADALNAEIVRVSDEAAVAIKGIADLRQDPGVDSEFERLQIEEAKTFWQTVRENLGIVVFNEAMFSYLTGLGEHLPGDENISLEDYAPIRYLALLFGHAISGGIAKIEADVPAGARIDFAAFRAAVLPRFESVVKSCKKNKVYKVEDVSFGGEPVRKMAIAAAEGFVAAFRSMDEVEFLLAEPATTFNGFEQIDRMFLPKKAEMALRVSEDIELAEMMSEDWVSSLKLDDLDERERERLYELWVERRDPIRGPKHTLNGRMRKEIAGILNRELHGDLALRHTGDITALLDAFKIWELEDIVRRNEELLRMRAFHEGLLKCLVEDCVARVATRAVGVVRQGFEETQGVSAGEVISVTAREFTNLRRFLEDVKNHIRAVIEAGGGLSSSSTVEDLREAFGPNFARIETRVSEFLSGVLSEPLAASLPGLDKHSVQAEIAGLRPDPTILLENLGKHNDSSPPEPQECDLERLIAKELFRTVYTALTEDGYMGRLLPMERELLRIQCQIHPIRPGIALEELMEEVVEGGFVEEWTKAINEDLWGGVEIRKDRRIEALVREIFVEIMIGMDEAEDEQEEEVTLELQERIDAVVRWVDSLPGTASRTYRRILADLKSRLTPDNVKNMPVYVTTAVVEKLEMCSRRATFDDKYVRSNLDDDDIGALMDVPILKDRRKWASVSKIGFRLEDLTRQIGRLRQQLGEKEQAREQLEAIEAELRAKLSEIDGYEEEIGEREAEIGAVNVAIGKEYNKAGREKIAVDQEEVARLRREKASLDAEKDAMGLAKQEAEDALPKIRRRIEEAAVEAGGLEDLLRKAEDLRARRKTILEGLDQLYDNSIKS